MKIAVMGASGHLGSRIVEHLLRRDVEPGDIVATVRHTEKARHFAERGVEVRHADYDDIDTLRKAYQGIDRLLLIPTFSMPRGRIPQLENALDAAKENNVGHVVEVAFAGVALDNPFHITPAYLYSESAVRLSGMNWTVLRNSLYTDPIVEWVPEIVEMGTIPYPSGEGRCAFVSRDDLARAAAAVLATDGHNGHTYTLTGPESLTVADLCDAVADVTGKPVEDKNATDEDYAEVTRRTINNEKIVQMMLSLYHAIREGFFDIVTDDIERLTGAPPDSFETILKRSLSSTNS